MESLSYYLNQMHQLLDGLLETAKNLCELSSQVVSEEELSTHQSKQKELLLQLEEVDNVLETQFWNQMEEKDHRALHDKIHAFQLLNQEFIKNLEKTHGLIQFELAHLQDQEEAEQVAQQLNKVASSSSYRTQTVKPKKSKKS